jgi:hypothetical protein
MYKKARKVLENFLIYIVRYVFTNKNIVTRLYLILFKKIRLYLYLSNKKIKCKLLNINNVTEECKICIVGSSFVLTVYVSEIIECHELLSRFSSLDACKIGARYGKSLKQALASKTPIKKTNDVSYFLTDKEGSYRLLTIDRDENVEYMDKKTKDTHIGKLMAIVRNRNLIKNFDPSQAAYLSILAELRSDEEINFLLKKITRNKKNIRNKIKKKRHLYIVE